MDKKTFSASARSIACLLGAAALIAACSKSDDSTTTPSATTSAATAAFNTVDKALAASIPATAAVSSVLQTQSGHNGALSDASEAFCGAGGGPLALGSESGTVNSDGDKILDESGNPALFNRRFWWCMMNHRSAGPDTVRGSIMKLKGFMCQLDKATGSGFVFDGQSHTVTIGLSTDCFTQQFVDMATPQVGTSVDLTYTASATASDIVTGADNTIWTHAIHIGVTAANIGYDVLLRMPTDGSEIAALIKQDSGGSDISVYSFDMSFSGANATVRYEGRFRNYDESATSNNWNRHIRVVTTGVYAGEGSFSSITSSKGVYADLYFNYSSGGSSTAYSIRTVNATDAGIKTDTYSGSASNVAGIDTGTSNNHVDNTCYTGCSITSLLTVNTASKSFLTLPTVSTDTSVFPGMAPLSFTDIDLTDDVP